MRMLSRPCCRTLRGTSGTRTARAVWRTCAALAAEYGYVEDEALYRDAPSRPVGSSVDAPLPVEERRPTTAQLLECRGLGLIVRCPSGIRYVSQAGGPICFWAHAEGAYVPLADDEPGSPGRRLFEHFCFGRDKTFMRAILAPDADYVDGVLADFGMGYVRVDRSRMGGTWDLLSWETWTGLFEAAWEAWVPVRVAPSGYDRMSGVLSGTESRDAILVWENSN